MSEHEPPGERHVPEVEALVDAFTRGSDDLVKYLREHDTAEYLIGVIAAETGLRRVFVRIAYNLLVGLIVEQSLAASKKLSGRLAGGTARVLRRLPFYGAVARAALRLEARLRQDERLKAQVDALMAGTRSARDFGDVEGLSREAKLGLQALKEQEEIWAETDRRFDELLGAINPRPPLTTRALNVDSAVRPSSRLLFNARRQPLVGRDAELRALGAFLDADRRLCWWMLSGPGGLGKSRLALELCLRHAVLWHRAGFLRRESTYHEWARWRPEAPTLIVVDYASSQAERAREIVTALRDREHELDAPVRVLFIDRVAEGQEWWRQFLSPDATGAEIRESCFREDAAPLVLGPLSEDNLWATIRHVVLEAGAPLPDRASLLQELHRIDPERRPLFAALAADAVAEGRDLRGWDRGRLLQDVLERERVRMWPPDASLAEINLLALATMCGPLPLREAERIAHRATLPPGFLPDFDPDVVPSFRPSRHAHMAGRPLVDVAGDCELPAFTPDLLGEFFVLRHVIGDDGRVLRQRAERLRDAAWAAPKPQAFAFAAFLHRCADDYLDEPALGVLAECPPASAPLLARRMWMRAGYGLVVAHARAGQWDAARAVLAHVRGVADALPDDPKVQAMAASTVGAFARALAGHGELDEAGDLRRWLGALAHARPEDDTLRGLYADSGLDYLPALVLVSRTGDVIELLEHLATDAERHPHDEHARLRLAAAVRISSPLLIHDGRFDGLRAVIARFEAVVTAYPGDMSGMNLRLQVANEHGLVLKALLQAGHPVEAHEEWGSLSGLLDRWPIPAVRMQVAYAAVDRTLHEAGRGRLDHALESFGWLSRATDAPTADEDLRLAHSAAGTTLMLDLAGAGRDAEALSIWRGLVRGALAHPTELLLRTSLLERAAALWTALDRAGSGESPRDRELLDHDVDALIDTLPAIADLRLEAAATLDAQLQRALEEDLDTLLRRIGERRSTDPVLRALMGGDDDRLGSASELVVFLKRLSEFATRVPEAVQRRLRGNESDERRMRLLAARGAVAVISALAGAGRQADAQALARGMADYIRSPELERECTGTPRAAAWHRAALFAEPDAGLPP